MSHIFMRFPGGSKKAVTLSYDDGVEQDVRLIDLMEAHGLKGTFNLNSARYAEEGTEYPEGTIHRRMSKNRVGEVYRRDGIEVAVHGATHPFLEQLPVNLCTKDLLEDRENLEEQFETIVRGMAYPYGTYNNQVVECMKSVGIVYSRTVHSTHNFYMPNDWMRLNATCHHNDPQLMELAHRFIDSDGHNEPWMFYLWGHSYEFEQNNNWEVIEEFASYVGGREEVWYATNIEIYEYTEAYNRLVFSMDGRRVYNPTSFELFFMCDGKLFNVQPGQTNYLVY